MHHSSRAALCVLQVLAGGLESFLGYSMAELGPMWADPIRSMREEIAAHGTADDALCFDYVANKLSGTEPKVWPNGVMDAAREQPVSLAALVRHHDARAAGLERHEVLACRLYTCPPWCDAIQRVSALPLHAAHFYTHGERTNACTGRVVASAHPRGARGAAAGAA